jgi:hypothetical protein
MASGPDQRPTGEETAMKKSTAPVSAPQPNDEELTDRFWQHIWVPVPDEPAEPTVDDSVDHTAGVLGDLDEQVREV